MEKENTKNEPDYVLEVSESQLKLINRAIEGYFRLLMGQFFDYASEIAKNNDKLNPNDPDYRKNFNSYLDRREAAEEAFGLAYAEAHPCTQNKTPEIQRLIDIWAQIRYQIWKDTPEDQKGVGIDSFPPILFSGDLPIYIRKESDIP